MPKVYINSKFHKQLAISGTVESMYVCMYVCIVRARVPPTLDPYAEALI